MKSCFARCPLLGLLLAICATCALSAPAFAQQPSTGLPPLGSFGGGPFDTLNLANLDVHFAIPIFGRAGKGIPFNYSMSYDSLVWSPVDQSGAGIWTPVTNNWGWRATTEAATGYVSYSDFNNTPSCPTGSFTYGENTSIWSGLQYHDPSGGVHPILGNIRVVVISSSSCGTVGTTLYPVMNAITTDNSGYRVTTNPTSALGPATVNARGGLKVVTPNVGATTGAGSLTDANLNQISINSSGVITDTLGTALTVTGTPSSGTVSYTYKAPSNPSAAVTFYYSHKTVQTCFQASGIAEFAATAEWLPYEVSLPDGSNYQFTYEATASAGTCTAASGAVTGRIASVTLPTGGVITYNYSGTGCGNNSNCVMFDGSPSKLTRALGGGTWTYYRAVQSGQQLPQTTTTVSDPSGNQTALNFSGIYETSRQVYQGTITGGTRLDYSYSCYNFDSGSHCLTATVTPPITSLKRQDALDTDPFGSGAMWSGIWYTYDTYGNLTEEDDYDYGNSSGHNLLRKFLFTLDTALCSNTNICDRPSSTQVQNPDGNQQQLTNYTYDTAPHHDTVGNLTLVSTWLTGTTYLDQQYSYNTGAGQGGTLASATDPKNTVTTYVYGAGSCGGAFPTSVSVPKDGGGSLINSYLYNCDGGVVTSVTDPNGAVVSTVYSDSGYWRPASVTDQTGVNPTTFSYPSRTQVESVMTFDSGNATIDMVSTSDEWGRPRLQQKGEGPAWLSFDTLDTEYDSSGRVFSVSLPATCYIGQLGCATVNTTTTYDALGRPLIVTVADGGTTTYSYNRNDVQVTAGQSRQMEYDALGRLSSVCEISSSSGTGCGQNHSPGTNGYNTSYLYNSMGGLTSAVQGSSQTRSFTYDRAERLTSEINPENGTTSYIYDTDSAGTCSSSTGDMVKKVNGAGTTCFSYDALHRVISAGLSGPVCRKYHYDTSSVNGVPMQNVAGRLAEALTDNCGTTGYTDEGFSYTARGEVSDVYESTPNSGGYYHVSSTYWADGVMNTLSGIPGVPTITYGVNVGGRPYTVSASLGQNPITYAAYNAAGQLVNLTFGSGDTDSFDYFPLTGRFKQYKYNIGSPTVTVEGDLAWNTDGTLQTLGITDGISSAKSQNCTYTYDDLGRAASVNCVNQNAPPTNVWNQVFTYDQYGNVKKAVPLGGTGVSFQPTYATTLNRFSSIPGVTGTLYDSVGNLQQDGSHTYTWDANWGNAATIDTKSLTFDAIGRMVEQTSGSTHTQILYGPNGGKLALMNGSTLQKAFIPLMGGTQAIYNSSGLYYYRHSDWLGSSRLAVLAATRAPYFDGAYAPFGEPYDYSPSVGNDFSFTGQNQDTTTPQSQTGIYDFLLREHSPVQGRWVSPDPAGISAVDITNPRTWNRYSYVMNNPLGYIDPLGLYCAVGDQYSHFSVGCGDVGLAWGSGIFAQWVTPTSSSSTTTDPNDPSMQSFTITHTTGYWMMGLPFSSNAYYTSGGLASSVLRPTYDKMEAGPPGLKAAHCQQVANATFLTNVLPGGNIMATALYTDSLTASEINSLTADPVIGKAVELAGASTGFKYAIRAATGVPMSVTTKFLGWVGIALTAKDVVESVNDSLKAYQDCMR